MTGEGPAAAEEESATERLARFALSAQLQDFDPAVRDTVHRRVIDTLAAITAGYRHVSGEVVRDHALDRTDGDSATILDGTGRTTSAADASLANATAANVLDVDDGHRDVKGHPAAVVVPAALAAAEDIDASVQTFLDAVYVGYEVAVRTGLAIHDVDGVYTGTGSWGAVGAAAAVGRLREYDVATMAAALGTAEYHAPRTPIMRGVEQPGMTKDGIGWGCYTGVEAATMSEAGFTASGTVFDDSPTHLDGLGTVHQITESYLKPYPCCRWAQPGVEAMRDLVAAADFTSAAIDRILIETFEEATHLETRHPGSIEAAEYSYAYPVAVTAIRGAFDESDLTPERWNDPAVESLVERVEFRTDDQIDDRFPEECLASVRVEANGRSYSSGVVRARGAVERPLSESAFERKIDDLFAPTLSTSAYEKVDATLNRPDSSVRQLLFPWE